MSKVSEKAMDMLKSGRISNHILIYTSGLYTEDEMKEEANLFRDFLVTKNGYMIMLLDKY